MTCPPVNHCTTTAKGGGKVLVGWLKTTPVAIQQVTFRLKCYMFDHKPTWKFHMPRCQPNICCNLVFWALGDSTWCALSILRESLWAPLMSQPAQQQLMPSCTLNYKLQDRVGGMRNCPLCGGRLKPNVVQSRHTVHSKSCDTVQVLPCRRISIM